VAPPLRGRRRRPLEALGVDGRASADHIIDFTTPRWGHSCEIQRVSSDGKYELVGYGGNPHVGDVVRLLMKIQGSGRKHSCCFRITHLEEQESPPDHWFALATRELIP